MTPRCPVSVFAVLLLLLATSGSLLAAGMEPAYHAGEYGLEEAQYAVFPLPLGAYEDAPPLSIWERLKLRAVALHGFNLVATIIFFLAITHTFIAGIFKERAHLHEVRHRELIEKEKRRGEDKPQRNARDDVSFRANVFHFLGEVEVVFGLWVLALCGAIVWFFGLQDAENPVAGLVEGFHQMQFYLGKDVNYTEPLFVIVIMAIAATRPVIRLSEDVVNWVAQLFGGSPAAWWFTALTFTPLLGSFITEPAAMTIAAMLLGKRFYELKPSRTFAYGTIGLLFVNVSVGGTLTHFAAPPVLMVAEKWDWGTAFMLANFGWKAGLGILISNALYFVVFRKQFADLKDPQGDRNMHMPLTWEEREDPVPAWITFIHLAFLAWTVFMAHFPALFLGGFLFLLGFTQATGHHQNDAKMRSPLLVGFFLAALVVHGRCQSWWIEILLTTIDNAWLLMIGATILTAFNDNAAVTYLASQAPGLPDIAKYAVVAGAVTGGGLTVIANAPNPAGQSILDRHFERGISPLHLALGAMFPTLILAACFMLLKTPGMDGPDLATGDPPYLTEEAFLELRAAEFGALDGNDDGVVTREEFIMEQKKLFLDLDRDHDGILSDVERLEGPAEIHPGGHHLPH